MADEQESMEDILDCFEDTLENMTAERCLKISTEKSDVLEMLAEGAICHMSLEKLYFLQSGHS